MIPLSRSSQVMNSLFFMLLFAVGASVANGQYMGFGGNVILCWRCEEAECNKYFDFTQHAAEQCDGKCWKSYDVVQVKSRKEQERRPQPPKWEEGGRERPEGRPGPCSEDGDCDGSCAKPSRQEVG